MWFRGFETQTRAESGLDVSGSVKNSRSWAGFRVFDVDPLGIAGSTRLSSSGSVWAGLARLDWDLDGSFAHPDVYHSCSHTTHGQCRGLVQSGLSLSGQTTSLACSNPRTMSSMHAARHQYHQLASSMMKNDTHLCALVCQRGGACKNACPLL